MKQKKIALDHEMDVLEEYTAEYNAALKEKLIQAILTQHPAQRRSYEDLDAKKERTQSRLQKLQNTHQLLNQLELFLSQVLSARQGIRKRGLWSYIVGRNPNIHISQQLQAIEKLSEGALPLFTEYPDMSVFLSDLHEQSGKRWGFKHLDTTFVQAHLNVQKFLERLKKDIATATTIETQIEVEICHWIDSF